MNKDKRNNIQLLGTLTNADESGIIANASQIYDDVQQKAQETINSELIEAVGTGGSVDSRIASAVATETSRAQEAEANRYTKNETYTKEELNNLITTPNQEYVSVTATDQTTAVTDVLPAIGLADTIYRVGSWDGSQYDVTKYSEYAWNGKDYVHLSTKTQICEVFDISVYHATGGTLATYDNLEDALGTNGENIPQSLRKGGMSVKFVQTSDNKYVQYRLMSNQFSTTVTDWQGVDDEPTAVSNNLVVSKGIQRDARVSSSNIRGLDFSSFAGNTEDYTKGIIFAGFVPTSGYTPKMVEIYALSKNKENDGLFQFWLWFGDNDHKFQFDESLSSLKNGINCIKASNDWSGSWGTLYLIVDISKYSDGETVIFGGTQGARVQVELLDANDTRICNWQNTYVNHLNLTDAADSQASTESIDLTLKSGNNPITHLVLPSATNEKAGLLSAKEKKYVDSEEAVRGLDFSNYTGDKSLYTKGIIFIGVVLADGYTPNEKPKIYALSKNNDGDNNLNLWLVTEIGGNEHRIRGSFDLHTLSKSNDGIACLMATGDLGTMYAIVNINAYTDGETVVWGGVGPFVEVNTILATDQRIQNWCGEALNQSVSSLNNYISEVEADLVKVESSTLTSIVQPIAATEIFKGVYMSDGSLNTDFERYSALYPVENENTYLYTNVNYPSVGVAGYDIVFLDANRNFVSGVVRGTQASYTNYRLAVNDSSIKYIAGIAGASDSSNASSLSLQTMKNKLDEPMDAIRSQFRCLDFSNYSEDKNPYYNSVIFAAAVRNGEKPDWQLDKIELYALGYNQNDNDRIEVGFYIGHQQETSKSIWFDIPNVSQLDDIPNIQCSKISDYGITIYLIYSPKYIYDYYQKYHASIIYGGTVGKRVCIENLLDSDPRIQAFNVNSNISALKTELESEIASLSFDSKFWKNKKLVWYGTSIPAGSDPTLGQKGIGITYPEIAATYLGATCNNEAVGSGRASYLAPVQNETYQHLMRCQGGTIASKLALFNDIYVIDDDNETVILGPNTYGVRDLPVSGTPTYAQAVSLRLEAIRFSYEIKLISRYLDSTNQYLLGVLNSQEVAASIHYTGGTGYELLHREDMDYKFTPDLFVFDHGTNDFGHMSNNDDVTTRDTTKFYGAMNMMYDLIQFYAPAALVCIVTDYGTSRYNSDLVIKQQQAWATYWQIPCLRTCDIVPWNGTVVTVQGYWDGTTAQGGQWHDDGFYFTVNGDAWETNNGIILRAYNSSTPASTIISRYNIRTIRGKQVYDIQQKYKFFKDGLHPHTDTSGNALKLYARYLSRLIETNVAPNKD